MPEKQSWMQSWNSALTTVRQNVPAVIKPNMKTGRGDLLTTDAQLANHRDIVIDKFGGDNLADVRLNGQLRDSDPDLSARARGQLQDRPLSSGIR